MRLNQITLPVSHIPRSKLFYESLGFQLRVSADHYCRFVAPQGSTTLSIHVETTTIVSAAVLYLEVDDVDAQVTALKARGVIFDTAPVDQRWLWREADFRDPDGHRWKIYHAGENRLDPPWAVKP